MSRLVAMVGVGSTRGPIVTLGVALVLAAAPNPRGVLAQTSGPGDADARRAGLADTPEELRAHLDSLGPLLAEARRDLDARNARMAAAERAAAEGGPRIDTFRVAGVGPRVLTPAGQSQATRALFDEVWDETFADLGYSPSLARSTITFQSTFGDPVPVHVEGEAHDLSLDGWIGRERTEDAIRRVLSQAMVHDLRLGRNPVGYWLTADPLPPEPLESVYRRIAVTRSKATRACLGGDAGACGSAMALGTTDRLAQLRAWYTPRERRFLVAERRPSSRRHRALRTDCVDEGRDAACDDLLADLSVDVAPLGPDVRRSLVAHALEVGPPGSWERLAEDPEMTPTEALEHASGQSIDELVEGWRTRLVAHRPGSFDPLIPSSGRTLAWSLLFAALALRSTRWRLG